MGGSIGLPTAIYIGRLNGIGVLKRSGFQISVSEIAPYKYTTASYMLNYTSAVAILLKSIIQGFYKYFQYIYGVAYVNQAMRCYFVTRIINVDRKKCLLTQAILNHK